MSATEWIASASIDDAPVIRKPTNFAVAMPRFARNAAAIALLLPSWTGASRLGDAPEYAREVTVGSP